MATQKIQSTRNYRLFKRSDENRVVDIKKHKALMNSMKEYGFLKCFPIIAHRNGAKQLTVKDGQHRLTIAEILNLPVHWIEDDSDFDIAAINSTAKVWQVGDYAMKFAANGVQSYQEAIEFATEHNIPLTIACGLLAGQSAWRHMKHGFTRGQFKITHRDWAESVVSVYGPLCQMSRDVRNVRFLQACMAACRVTEFEPQRLLQNAKRCREKLVSYSTREAYLDMLEDIYNFGRAKLFGLKAAAQMVMRDRNPVKRGRKVASKKAS
jgi:hypothetical protein